MSSITSLNDWITANSFRTQTNTNFTNLNTDKQETSGKDATGGYAGLTLFKINFKNVANTFTSFFTNSNTDSRTYTFQDRDGTIADNTDLATKAALAWSISQAFSVSQLEVGNASDTSITRSSAGVIAVEWVVVDTISGANTLTNKRITKRVTSLSANSATPAINTDLYDVCHITAQTATITGFTMTGTPVDWDTLRISITGTATVPFTLGSSFEASGWVPLSTTTTGTARLDMWFFWNTETSKWRQVAAS